MVPISRCRCVYTTSSSRHELGGRSGRPSPVRRPPCKKLAESYSRTRGTRRLQLARSRKHSDGARQQPVMCRSLIHVQGSRAPPLVTNRCRDAAHSSHACRATLCDVRVAEEGWHEVWRRGAAQPELDDCERTCTPRALLAVRRAAQSQLGMSCHGFSRTRRRVPCARASRAACSKLASVPLPCLPGCRRTGTHSLKRSRMTLMWGSPCPKACAAGWTTLARAAKSSYRWTSSPSRRRPHSPG